MKMRTATPVMACSPRRTRRHLAARRGVSLIEGMVASVVLLIGLSAVFQAIMVASQQNSLTNLASRGAGIASQVRVALESLGPDRVVGPSGILTRGQCSSSANVLDYAGGLDKLRPATGETWKVLCIFDLDAYELSQSPADQLLPGYSQADRERFHRVLVWVSRSDDASKMRVQQLTVVVSWSKTSNVKQYLNLYDAGPDGNASLTEI